MKKLYLYIVIYLVFYNNTIVASAPSKELTQFDLLKKDLGENFNPTWNTFDQEGYTCILLTLLDDCKTFADRAKAVAKIENIMKKSQQSQHDRQHKPT